MEATTMLLNTSSCSTLTRVEPNATLAPDMLNQYSKRLAVPSLGSSPTQPYQHKQPTRPNSNLAVPSLGSSPTQLSRILLGCLETIELAVPSLGSSPTQPWGEQGQ